MAYENVSDVDARAIRECVAAILAPETAPRPSAPCRAHCRIEWNGRNEFYSYGRHFPLARYVPRGAAGRRAPAVWIVNGDEWRGPNSRTRTHQEKTRETLAGTGIPSIVLPFSALDGAGIVFESIRPIHIRPDAEWLEWDPLPDSVDLDALETADACEIFGDGPRDAAGYEYVWRGADGRKYSRTLYRRAHCYTGETSPAGYPIGEWREVDGREFAENPAELAVSEHSYLNGNLPLERRADGWRIVRRVHRLGDSLFSAERVDAAGERRRRAVYLSSFDYQEFPPLYFIAEIPRGAGADTVETALDALAPRAVHAAYARGVDVRRQGDVFFIASRQTREMLAADGATFARLTQWTRDAAPRAGEIGYVPRPSAPERRRRAELERRARMREWRERFRATADAYAAGYASSILRGELERAARRAETRDRFRELFERHARELAACRAAGADPTAPESLECTCGAGIGEQCRPIPAADLGSASLAERLELERLENGRHSSRGIPVSRTERAGILARQRTELFELRRDTAARSVKTSRPETPANGRASYAARRRRAAADVDRARDALRRAVFADPANDSGRYSYRGETVAQYRRRARVERIKQCRETLARELRELEESRHARGATRDGYRAVFDRPAVWAMRNARHNAAVRYRPEDIDGTETARWRRERVRAAVAIFGTAHAATETARMPDGRVYARGTVRHVPELEPGRNGEPDHRPLTLADGVWYLAVRNTVPRQRRRRRSRRAETIGR